MTCSMRRHTRVVDLASILFPLAFVRKEPPRRIDEGGFIWRGRPCVKATLEIRECSPNNARRFREDSRFSMRRIMSRYVCETDSPRFFYPSLLPLLVLPRARCISYFVSLYVWIFRYFFSTRFHCFVFLELPLCCSYRRNTKCIGNMWLGMLLQHDLLFLVKCCNCSRSKENCTNCLFLFVIFSALFNPYFVYITFYWVRWFFYCNNTLYDVDMNRLQYMLH